MNPWQKTTKGSIGWPGLQGSAVIKIRFRRFKQVAGFTAMTQIKVRETGSEALLGREWRRLELWLWATSGEKVSGPVFVLWATSCPTGYGGT